MSQGRQDLKTLGSIPSGCWALTKHVRNIIRFIQKLSWIRSIDD